MAYPVHESVGTASRYDGSASSITVPNPSGLTAGDEMCLFVFMYETGSTQTINTPSGWTSRQNSGSQFVSYACFTKTATAGDVSAGSVTITSTGGSDLMSASIHRITGAVLPSVAFLSEIDIKDDNSATLTHTTALTPTTAESLILVFFAGARASGSTGVPTISGYATTPSASYTEVADIGVQSGGLNLGHGVAWANYAGTTEITSRTATASQSFSRNDGSIIVIYSAPQNAQGTNATFAVSPSFFNENGVASTQGTNALLTVSPEMFDQSGEALQPTPWTTVTKS